MDCYYRHTQVGYLIIVSLGIGLAGICAALIWETFVWPGLALAVLLAVSLVLFASLTIEIKDNCLQLHFGPGLIRRSFPLASITGCRVVTNPWYYGWGIHFTPHGWLFNVCGNQAVEIVLQNQRRYRLGSDEPHLLLTALQQVLADRNNH